MKKARNFVIILLAAVVLIIALGSGGSKDKQKEAESSTPEGSDVIVEEETAPLIEEIMGTEDSASEASVDKKELREAFDKSFDDGVTIFYNSVRNDVTGKWRSYICATPNNITDFAVDYYNAYFEDDSEIHFVVNFQLGTTTRISKIGNMLDLTVHEYTDGEEHDAKALAGGTVLSQTQITL